MYIILYSDITNHGIENINLYRHMKLYLFNFIQIRFILHELLHFAIIISIIYSHYIICVSNNLNIYYFFK